MVHRGKKVRVKDGKIDFYLDTPYVSRNRPFYATIPVKLVKEAVKAIKNLAPDDTARIMYCPVVVFSAFQPYLKLKIYKRGKYIVFMVEHPYEEQVHRHRFDYIDVLEALTEVSDDRDV